MQDVAHALEDACALLCASPRAGATRPRPCWLAGSGLLVDLVRDASPETDPTEAAAFVKQVRESLAAHAGPQPPTSPERRQGDRRGAARAADGADARGQRGAGRLSPARRPARGAGGRADPALLPRRSLSPPPAPRRSLRGARRARPGGRRDGEDAAPAGVDAHGDPTPARFHGVRPVPENGSRHRAGGAQAGSAADHRRRDLARQGGAGPPERTAASPGEQRRGPWHRDAGRAGSGWQAGRGTIVPRGLLRIGAGRNPGVG